ncbi:MAG: NADH-quinone oxidoreductase subunit H [Desulfobacterales bacterium]|nr:NADH-quinone oxidoreductase subunit H [Desulfobacterales bacterium]
MINSLILLIISIIFSPFFSGLILKVKAFFAGKKGPPVLIHYYTLIKLFKKGSVYSKSTTYIFKLAPIVTLGVSITSLMFFPFSGYKSVFAFEGDIIMILYLFGTARFFTILAALDTASPFEGMGAAREAYFAIFAEASLFMILIFFSLLNKSLSFSDILLGENAMSLWKASGVSILFIIISLFMILLVENTRVPIDDPATHLELTMIHEVMILDHSGPDLALIELGASFKLLFYSSFITCLVFPFKFQSQLLNVLCFFIILSLVYMFIGIVESVIARYKMDKIPKFILSSFALAVFATIFIWR